MNTSRRQRNCQKHFDVTFLRILLFDVSVATQGKLAKKFDTFDKIFIEIFIEIAIKKTFRYR